MALGSIAHLQHSFIRMAIVAAREEDALDEHEDGNTGADAEGREEGTKKTSLSERRAKSKSKPAPLNLHHRRQRITATLAELPPTPTRPAVDDRLLPWEKFGAVVGDGNFEVKGRKELRREMVEGLRHVVTR